MKPYYADFSLTVHIGDCRAVMAEMDPESVHCVVTSPPYWGLRDYGVPGQLGLEATPEAYVAAMVDVLREVRRVLRDDGTLWLNLGDSYAANGTGGGGGSSGSTLGIGDGKPGRGVKQWEPAIRAPKTVPLGLKPKDLVGIPWRVAFALQADGWYLRSDIIWSKPNPMPESVTDRPTKAHEYLFLLSKSPRYYFDSEAVREAAAYPDGPNSPQSIASPYGQGFTRKAVAKRQSASALSFDRETKEADVPGQSAKQHRLGRDRPLGPKGEATPDGMLRSAGARMGRGAGWRAELERERNVGGRDDGFTRMPGGEAEWAEHGRPGRNLRSVWTIATQPYPGAHFATFPEKLVEPCVKAGCPPDGVVLDPFAGSGTVGRVANRLGRRAVLIDLSADYIDQAMLRNAQAPLGLVG